MTKWHEVMTEFQVALAKFLTTPAIQRLNSGDVELKHYQAILRQIFHHARENPQIQALATVYFRGEQRETIKRFYAHASSEIGHDQLALDDLVATGMDVSSIPSEYPLPSTSALLAFAFYQIQNHNPVGYLGYLFFLEFTPTAIGGRMLEQLAAIGVPADAMSFLQDHTTIDVHHNKMMEGYVEDLVQNEADLAAVKYAIQTTGHLYAAMLTDAIENAEENGSARLNYEEQSRAA
ncbi:MAG: iron-containing redox enzyme family protein [Pseudomonadota bacterium]